MYLLDTTHCSLFLKGAQSDEPAGNSLCFLSVATTTIVAGELAYMALKSAYPSENMLKVQRFLEDIVVYPVTRECAPKYGEVKDRVVKCLGPKQKSKRYKISIERLGFSDNDLWIAAVARTYDLTVISGDRDFQRLRDAGVADLKVETW